MCKEVTRNVVIACTSRCFCEPEEHTTYLNELVHSLLFDLCKHGFLEVGHTAPLFSSVPYARNWKQKLYSKC